MHNQYAFPRLFHTLDSETEEPAILTERGEKGGPLPLPLNSEHHNDVDIRDGRFHIGGDLGAQLLGVSGQQCGRSCHADLHSHLSHGLDSGTRHPAVADISHDGDLEIFQASQTLSDGEQVEEGLGGMLVGPVPRVNDRGLEAIGQDLGRPRDRVANDHHIRSHGLKGFPSIEEGLALGHRRNGCGNVDDIGTEPFAGNLERGPRAGARLVKEVDQGFSSQRRDLLDVSRGDLFHRLSGVQDQMDLIRLQLSDR